jgi:dipeptidyl aminopeptidase/acylaminoacyl peptidase
MLAAWLVAAGLLLAACRSAVTPAETPQEPMALAGPLPPAQTREPAPDRRGPELLPDLQQRFQDPSWFAQPPSGPAFGLDGRGLYFERPRPNQGGPELRYLELATGLERAALPGERLLRRPERRANQPSDRPLWLEHAGDLFVLENGSAAPRQLTRTRASEQALVWLAAGRRLAYESDGALLCLDLDSGLTEQLFEWRFEEDPDLKAEPELDLLAADQERLIATLAGRAQRREEAREREREDRRSDPYRARRPFYLPTGLEARLKALSPSGRHVALAAGPKSGEDRRDLMPDYVTESSYVETRPVRPHVGLEQRPGQRLFLLDAETLLSHEVDWRGLPGVLEQPLAELEAAREARLALRRAQRAAEAPAAGGDQTPPPTSTPEPVTEGSEALGAQSDRDAGADPAVVSADPVAGDHPTTGKAAEAQPRALLIERLRWAPNAERLLVELRSTDNKDRWLCLLNPAGTIEKVLEHHRDPAWIGWDFAQWDWLPDGSGAWWLSERSGFAQLYVQDLDAAAPRVLTPAGAEASSPSLSPDGRYLYLISNATHPGIHQLARVRWSDGAFELLSAPEGRVEDFALSPDGRQVALLRSYAHQPGEIFLQNTSALAPARRLTHSTTPAFDELALVEPRFVEFPGPGGTIHARLYLPPAGAPDRRLREPVLPLEGQRSLAAQGTAPVSNESATATHRLPAAANGQPAVLFIHGAGYLQNAHQGWSGYFHEFFFHDLLARQGIVVLDLDYRASAGYGRDWRCAVHRKVGQPELEDLAAGVRYLVQHHGVDAARIGVYGGSYGGFLTLLALFKAPELFACGAALRPVTDWRHYNDGYTRNLMETPELDPEGFAASSPIDHAEGLARPLLICHGLLDDNVLAKDSIRLSQRLIELGKTDWDLCLYPLEPHGFREPASWIDEYTRIWLLFQRCLL